MNLTLLINLYVPGRTRLHPDLLLLQRQDTSLTETNETCGWRAFIMCATLLRNQLPLIYVNQKAAIILT